MTKRGDRNKSSDVVNTSHEEAYEFKTSPNMILYQCNQKLILYFGQCNFDKRNSLDKTRGAEKPIDIGKVLDEEAHASRIPLIMIPIEESNKETEACTSVVVISI